ncbi:hypothetical protein GCM10007147_23800 [Nocardiopsis kunsanensis]|uniref:Uncharacterized protein n=1 Tax=Nocardiopsis kunsanensis TaxID=141693 RepID=A0A919CHP0_9ACTN|nr:hypothetical protein GCM10007147_23800 [Nocardiopsis kunsanensis]
MRDSALDEVGAGNPTVSGSQGAALSQRSWIPWTHRSSLVCSDSRAVEWALDGIADLPQWVDTQHVTT